MSLLGLGRRSVEDPNVPLSSPRLLELLRGVRTSAGAEVSESSALGLTAYYRAVVLTAGTIASLPCKVYRIGTRDPVTSSTVVSRPNPRQTRFEFWFTYYANALSWGNGLAHKVRDRAGIVVEVWPLHPSRARIEEVERSAGNPEGKLFLVRRLDGSEERLTSRDVFHLPFLSPNGLSGVTPLQAFIQPLGVAMSAERGAAEFYGSGMMAPGYLSTDAELAEDDANRIRRNWDERNATGARGAGRVPLLYGGLKFTPLTIPPADAQVLESRRFGVQEIARMFGVPPHLLGDVSGSTSWGTGIEQQTIAWNTFGLRPWLVAGEERITMDLLPGGLEGDWFAEYLLDGLLRADSAARASAYATAVQWGWMSRAEVRARENLPPGSESLDEFLTPSNMTLINVDGSIQPLGGAGAAQQQGSGDASSSPA